MPVLERPDAEIHYDVVGNGYPVLMFAPGFLSSRRERWATNPAKPGVDQPWADPVPVLAPHFQLVLLDVRNAGQSIGAIKPGYDWYTYTDDHLALLDHLGIERCHVMGACIGVSFALSVAEVKQGLVTSLVLQNPIGRVPYNGEALQGEYDQWAAEVGRRDDVDPAILPAIGKAMFGGDFVFSVTPDFVAGLDLPILLMPGDDVMHPTETSAELASLAGNGTVVSPWKGGDHRDAAMLEVRDFLLKTMPDDHEQP
ncbi:MAG: alpha/beta hydrolase [Alphaproteobacteria bacterium]